MEDTRDLYFVCGGCGGNLVVVDTLPDGRKVYNCDKCGKNKLFECVVCHKPKSIWADDGEVCGGCALQAMSGEIKLTKKQVDGINKWAVEIPVKAKLPEN
ncbi:MAG: hypothetical protein PHP03_01665 [Candidatus Pacebacteria bacterium]|nr:hypothetical protein [Candidatus Paceibacterota bacterium]